LEKKHPNLDLDVFFYIFDETYKLSNNEKKYTIPSCSFMYDTFFWSEKRTNKGNQNSDRGSKRDW
jgi:hypothetical protein